MAEVRTEVYKPLIKNVTITLNAREASRLLHLLRSIETGPEPRLHTLLDDAGVVPEATTDYLYRITGE